MSNIEWRLDAYQDLDKQTLLAILQQRQDVFVIEQNCVYPDIDGLDESAWHLSGWNGSATPGLVAYARIHAPGGRYEQASISRVLTSRSARGSGAGQEIMQRAIAFIESEFVGASIRIGAQLYLLDFYQQLGFSAVSDAYDEDGIMHVDMLRE